MSSTASLVETAPAKVNLTLRVLGRRPDGYHDLQSLVAFADVGDTLRLSPGDGLTLAVHGPSAAQAGPDADNLVLKAASALRLEHRRRAARRVRAGEGAAGRRRPRRRLGRCRGGVAAPRPRQRAAARRRAALRGGLRDRRRRAGLPRSARPRHARHRRNSLRAARAAAAAGGFGQFRRGGGDQGCVRAVESVAVAGAAVRLERGRRDREPRPDIAAAPPTRPTTWKSRRSPWRRPSPKRSPRCARSQAAAWRACRVRAQPALRCSRPPPKRFSRRRP